MQRQQLGLYAIGLAILIVGLIALGVPAQWLLVAAVALACPLMMIFMHGDHGVHGGTDRKADDHDHQITSLR